MIPAACLLAVTFVKCEHIAVVALMTIAVTAMGGMFSGVLANHIDIAPQYAGIHLYKDYYMFFSFSSCVYVCLHVRTLCLHMCIFG